MIHARYAYIPEQTVFRIKTCDYKFPFCFLLKVHKQPLEESWIHKEVLAPSTFSRKFRRSNCLTQFHKRNKIIIIKSFFPGKKKYIYSKLLLRITSLSRLQKADVSVVWRELQPPKLPAIFSVVLVTGVSIVGQWLLLVQSSGFTTRQLERIPSLQER